MPAYLDTIVAAHRAEASADRRDLDAAVAAAANAGPVRPFDGAIRASIRPPRDGGDRRDQASFPLQG